MKVFVVVGTEGDYIGYFSSHVVGCFTSIEAANKAAEKRKRDYGGIPSEVIVEEVEIQE